MRREIISRIYQAVFYIHSGIQPIIFPFDSIKAVSLYENCRYITYDDLAAISNVSHEEVIRTCESYDGCTKYDKSSDRYLIIVNRSSRNARSEKRINWTIAHELGHIICGHFNELAGETLSSEINSKEMEEEADFFAASLLAPIPALLKVGVRNVGDIKQCFGLSQQAAEYRWAEFQHYCKDPDKYASLWEMQKISKLLHDCGIKTKRVSGRWRESVVPIVKPLSIIPDEDY